MKNLWHKVEARLERIGHIVRRLASRDGAAVAKMTFLLPAVRLALHIWSYQRLQEWATRSPARTGSRDGAYLERHAWAAGAMGRRLLGSKPCLTQALALQWLLSRRGYQTTLHLGVRQKAGGGIEAHAWVTHGGRTIVGGWRSRYVYRLLRSVSSEAGSGSAVESSRKVASLADGSSPGASVSAASSTV